MEPERISSPAATSGSGAFFEQHVNAFWLAQLLVGGIPPILRDCSVVQVSLQTERLGWHTDDFLIVGRTGSGTSRKLAGQVKRTFTISAGDEECQKTIRDLWQDFNNPATFSRELDRFALVILRGTNTLLVHFNALLDCARSARDAAEFDARLAVPGLLSSKAIHYCDEICTIVGGIEEKVVTRSDVWPMLGLLHVLSLDLGTPAAQTTTAITSLLAFTTTESEPMGAAETSWNALLAIASEGMQASRTFDRNDLPMALRQKHGVVARNEQQALVTLSQHADVILHGITSTLGKTLHLRRASLVQNVLDELNANQVIIVTGPAGSGKSSVAKDALELLASDYFTFAFRGEEFAQPHFDSTLHHAQIPANAAALDAVLAAQDRKVVLVESMERLLEHGTRDAFEDLVTKASKDPSLRIILTCRDYSADLVRASFLGRVSHSVVSVPLLDDAELAEVQSSFPTMAAPLAHPGLRKLMRTPYFLDKALQVQWSIGDGFPENERAFRQVFWRQIVRAEGGAALLSPQDREHVFQEIALRRARSLTPYVNSSDLTSAVVDRLVADSLLVSSVERREFVAPAHDVLEDWAILEWIEHLHFATERVFNNLSNAIGGYPALRRAYRRWIAEVIDREPGLVDKLLDDALADGDTSHQFRDDTLVSLMRAPSSAELLRRRAGDLTSSPGLHLKRLIHVLRVACVTTPAWLPATLEGGSLFSIPDGSAWGAILDLAHRSASTVEPKDRLLLLGLIEDWAKSVTWWSHYPTGSESAVGIALALLPHLDTYRTSSTGQRVLKVIAKVPKSDAASFQTLLQGKGDESGRNHTSEAFRDLILSTLEGSPAARDLPDLVVSVAKEYLLCSEGDLESRPRYYATPLEMGTQFGLKSGLRHDFFPASAYRGPWLSLLRNHPKKAVDFLVEVFNHSIDWYANPRVPDRLEPPFEVVLSFADGSTRKQWATSPLWNLYRGTAVGPYVLQSLLMALEQWLLEFAEAYPTKLDGVLERIIRESNSACLTSVVASVATAFPQITVETLLVLLRSRESIWLDRHRLGMESQSPSVLDGLMRLGRGENQLYADERKQSDALPHRQRDLEIAITALQVGPHASRVHEILDRHRASLPPVAEQTEEDRLWRISMHRMDLRDYEVLETAASGLQGQAQDETSGTMLQLQMNQSRLEQDVKEIVDNSAAKLAVMSQDLNLLMWAQHVFGGGQTDRYDPTEWRQHLTRAKEHRPSVEPDSELDIGRNGPGIVAAVCIRDHWDEMSTLDQAWCVTAACGEVARTANDWDDTSRVQQYPMASDRSCAFVLSILVSKQLPDDLARTIRPAFVAALTHPVDEVRSYAALGVGRELWAKDASLAMRCVNAMAIEAAMVEEGWEAERRRRYDEQNRLGDVQAKAAATVRERFWLADGIPDTAYGSLNVATGFGAEANERILAILSVPVSNSVAVEAYKRAAETLVGWWNSRHDRKVDDTQRNYFLEARQSELLQRFLMRTTQESATQILRPVLAEMNRNSRELQSLMQGLISVEDVEPRTEHFWYLWGLFADGVRELVTLHGVDAVDEELVRAVFLGTWWKDQTRHWKSLEGHGHHVRRLFEDLPPSAPVLEHYVRFLYHVGEKSLPDAFVGIAKKLRVANTTNSLGEQEVIFMLEVLLQRNVYSKPLALKTDPELRTAILYLLDVLVDSGSSSAYRMRDDFVTPVAG